MHDPVSYRLDSKLLPAKRLKLVKNNPESTSRDATQNLMDFFVLKTIWYFIYEWLLYS